MNIYENHHSYRKTPFLMGNVYIWFMGISIIFKWTCLWNINGISMIYSGLMMLIMVVHSVYDFQWTYR